MQFKRSYVPVVSPVEGWQLRGACRAVDPELFFGPEVERSRAKRVREAAAVAVCAGCPVRVECRAEALAPLALYGVWGGLTEADRLGEFAASHGGSAVAS
jgi:WhiB family transcriptional regulator, redox-sensing transcriptional regulator